MGINMSIGALIGLMMMKCCLKENDSSRNGPIGSFKSICISYSANERIILFLIKANGQAEAKVRSISSLIFLVFLLILLYSGVLIKVFEYSSWHGKSQLRRFKRCY